MASTYASAAEFVRIVRNFSQVTPDWAVAARHWVLPNERYDPTLISLRVYGNRREFLAVMAAAGNDTLEQEITPKLLVLPTAAQLEAIKARAGFVNDAAVRSKALAASPILGR